MNHEELFIMTMNELRERIKSNFKYDFVKACGLLRLLLMDDGAPLYVIVNRKYNVEILFAIAETPLD